MVGREFGEQKVEDAELLMLHMVSTHWMTIAISSRFGEHMAKSLQPFTSIAPLAPDTCSALFSGVWSTRCEEHKHPMMPIRSGSSNGCSLRLIEAYWVYAYEYSPDHTRIKPLDPTKRICVCDMSVGYGERETRTASWILWFHRLIDYSESYSESYPKKTIQRGV